MQRVDARGPKIVGFLCDWAVSAEGIAREDGTLRDLPNVTLVKVPCSGFVRPAWLEYALRNGAEGAFVCGCPLGDCFNRLGNNLIADRVVQIRRRFERQRIHPDRVATIFHGLHDQHGFLEAVRAFSARVAALPGPVIPPARAAARPAVTSSAAEPRGRPETTPPGASTRPEGAGSAAAAAPGTGAGAGPAAGAGNAPTPAPDPAPPGEPTRPAEEA